MLISDCTQAGQYSYRCTMQRGNVTAVATARQVMLRPFSGAYELTASTANVTGAALGRRQRETAADLRLEAIGNLSRALYAAGWRSETVTWAGRTIVRWLPPREVQE